MAKDEQRTAGGEHRDVGACHLNDALTPNACCVDHHAASHLDMAAVALVEQLHALDAVLVDHQSLYLMVVERLGAMQTCVKQVGYGQAKRVD